MYMPANETKALRRKTHKMQPWPPFECIALLHEPGGAQVRRDEVSGPRSGSA
jgi:hypothetical protein